ncbi:hypothetical protein BKA83DRAFT_4488637 [Pisolithus microcarpus]|nr:hypothetical protein BKA83DRAFT_4488637 [Pisolithus microcarpus]
MPELPAFWPAVTEVERAAALIREHAVGKLIHHVDTFDDSLVFSGFAHLEFAREITGRVVEDAARYGNNLASPQYNVIRFSFHHSGKCFYIQLQGSGRTPVLHFGMTGALQVRGHVTVKYKSTASSASDVWPPRFVKFILYIQDGNSAPGFTEIAFSDARRLGRIRLVGSPLDEPPISELGFDPVLSMPSLEDFHASLSKRTCPIKALLLDQAFSAGVGNYLADEILYQARVHPEQRCSTLDRDQVIALHHHVADVCRVAVQANADDSKYPEHWLFKHRWGKGKNAKTVMKLPSGEPATIKWITVGGRTSAYVAEVQKLSSSRGNVLNSTAV